MLSWIQSWNCNNFSRQQFRAKEKIKKTADITKTTEICRCVRSNINPYMYTAVYVSVILEIYCTLKYNWDPGW